MVPHPDEATLLRAVAQFLNSAVRPVVPDRAVAFRLRIAAHLLTTTANSLASGEARESQAVRDLAGLLNVEPNPQTSRREALLKLQTTLANRLGSDSVDREASFEWLKTTLAAQLAIDNPRFDLGLDVEQK
jgi:hypothetical protein